MEELQLHLHGAHEVDREKSPEKLREMLFRGTERNRCGIFRQMLNCGTGNIKAIKLRYSYSRHL